MKKTVKIMSTILLVIMLLTSVSSVVFATDAKSALKSYDKATVDSNVMNFGNTIVPIVRAIGVIAAVVILMVVGIKYMMGSAEEKAEYKKTMPAYVIGAVLVFAASQVIAFIAEMASGISA